jgi:hypothetical protein
MPESQFANKIAKKFDSNELDLPLLADIVDVVNIYNGSRLLKFGHMTENDVCNCQKITESLSSLLFSHRK